MRRFINPSLDVLHLLADLLNDYPKLNRGGRGLGANRLCAQRIRPAIKLLIQKVQSASVGTWALSDMKAQAIKFFSYASLLRQRYYLSGQTLSINLYLDLVDSILNLLALSGR